jgi:DNA topoisomerase-3
LVDLYKNWDVDDFLIVPSIWKMKETESKKRQLKITGNLLKKANEVIISTDGDREGEVIGRELLMLNRPSNSFIIIANKSII